MFRRLAGLILLAAQPAAAQTALPPATLPITWAMATEYPATAIPGEGVSTFTALVRAKTGGRLVIEPSFDASRGIKSAAMLDAVREGRVEVGDAFAGALGGADPIFALSSLPFLATSIAEAKRLTDLARPRYEGVLAARGQRLLYTTPWPPSGIWSRRPLAGAADLNGLAIRTYDATSMAVMNAAGAKAVNLSFADAMPKLRDGSLDAVLSSGDGGAGQRLWEILPNFAEITYAMPISIATMNQAAFAALPDDLKGAVEAAARETEQRQWAAIVTRQRENHDRIRGQGVSLNPTPDPTLMQALRAAAAPAIAAWTASAGADGAALLARFRQDAAAR
jgi:TRAP-type C4-dicarboxylate transport system substrate-binding protein